MNENNRNIRYYQTFSDDFIKSVNQKQEIPQRYKWVHTNRCYLALAKLLYGIALIFGMIYSRVILQIHVVNKKALKEAKGSGYFLYGNHTQPIGDVFAPARYIFPKRMYAIASPANLGIPVIGTILPMLGGLIIPGTMGQMKEFMEAIEYHIQKKSCIVIYPEAHVWPYCSFIRPFPETSFRFPVQCNAPCYSMTTTYQKRKRGRRPKITVFIDGPFYPDLAKGKKREQRRLHDEVYAAMVRRSKNNTYVYIDYQKQEKVGKIVS
ncbi:MAG: acyl-phosphate glycerol 3-phosphate acyltransferase [bacterium]|nr:acyl-phosphate glycerol 3-phosphate acyltransferase [bacterium]